MEYAIFLWKQFTPSVRVGRRYPAVRNDDGSFQCDVAEAQYVEGLTLEVVRRDGVRVGLWNSWLYRHVNPDNWVRTRLDPT